MNISLFIKKLNKKSVFSECVIYQWASLSQSIIETRAHTSLKSKQKSNPTNMYIVHCTIPGECMVLFH